MSENAFFLRRMNDHIQYLGRIKATLADMGDFGGTDHHSCKLGQWLDTEGLEQVTSYSNDIRAVFDSLLLPHEQFHQASHRAIECKANGDYQGMEAAITEMFKLSVTLVDTLMELDLLGEQR
jgi:hypothetical protein